MKAVMDREVPNRVSASSREAATSPLPAGQRESADFTRFGLPKFARRLPSLPKSPVLAIVGEVESPCEIPLEELEGLPRHEQQSDFHCVTTWSHRGLNWSGYRFRDVYEQLIVPRAKPRFGARWLQLRGLDGCAATLMLEDALAADVMLADRLDGEPLTLEHGAPLRVVAPAHYGYKSVKHLCAIELRREYVSEIGAKEHPRARVAREERGANLPGWILRRIYRPIVGLNRWWYRRAGRTRKSP